MLIVWVGFSFREVEVEEGHPVVDLKWSDTGSNFLASSASLNVRLFDRDGKVLSEYIKGDPYILDMQHTRGHVAAICNVSWDCFDTNRFLTASADATVRIWDFNRTNKQIEVIKAKNARNTRVPITAMSSSPWESSKNLVLAACMDGSIQIWPVNGNKRQPLVSIRAAHQNNTETSSIQVSRDGIHFMSRGGDDTLKYWDMRKPQKPIAVIDNLENAYQQTACIFSPDEQIMVTGTSTRPGHGVGKLMFYSLDDSVNEIHQIDVCDNSVVSLNWHPKLNQVIAGCGDNIIRTFYSPNLSRGGVLMCRDRDPKRKTVQGYVAEEDAMNIHNPNAIFRESTSTKRQKLKARRDPIKSRKPDLPVVTGVKGHSGQISQHVVDNMIIVDEAIKDPREALLKYSEVAANDPRFFGDAYKQTQPAILFSDETDDPNAPEAKKLE